MHTETDQHYFHLWCNEKGLHRTKLGNICLVYVFCAINCCSLKSDQKAFEWDFPVVKFSFHRVCFFLLGPNDITHILSFKVTGSFHLLSLFEFTAWSNRTHQNTQTHTHLKRRHASLGNPNNDYAGLWGQQWTNNIFKMHINIVCSSNVLIDKRCGPTRNVRNASCLFNIIEV